MSSNDMPSTETSSPGSPSGKPPVFASARLAWTDGMSALAQMPTLVFVAFATVVAQGSLRRLVVLLIDAPGSAASLVIVVLIGVATTFFVTPVYLAIHRRILLGETTQGYQLAAGTPRFQHFFTGAAALYVFTTVPGLLPNLLGVTEPEGTFTTILMVVVMFVSVRATLLFPAIAVDAPGANFTNAFADSAGHFWRIFAIGFVATLPLIILVILLYAVLGMQSTLASFAAAMVRVLGVVVLIAVASRLYQRLGNRLRGAPDAAVTA